MRATIAVNRIILITLRVSGLGFSFIITIQLIENVNGETSF